MQEALQAELNHNFENLQALETDCERGFQQLSQCAYVEAVVRETLRLHPPIKESLKRVNVDLGSLTVMGYEIPKGVSSRLT